MIRKEIHVAWALGIFYGAAVYSATDFLGHPSVAFSISAGAFIAQWQIVRIKSPDETS